MKTKNVEYVDLGHPLHNFDKVNMVGISSNRGIYDLYRCKKCGLEGKRFALDSTLECISSPKIKKCNGEKLVDKYIGKRVQITYCLAQGKSFSNLTPGSKHRIIKPPLGWKMNGDGGVCVMGVGEPVKILFDEFMYKPLRTTKAKK